MSEITRLDKLHEKALTAAQRFLVVSDDKAMMRHHQNYLAAVNE